MEHFPAIIVLAPLLAAPLCLIIRHNRLVQYFSILVSWACLFIAVMMLIEVRELGPISYSMGGWSPPLGIEYRVDLLNVYLLIIVTTIASVVLAFGPGSVRIRVPKEREYLYYAAFLLSIAGLLGIVVTGDAFNIFVFLEISSLATYTLIALGSHRRALRAALSYLLMGTVGGTFILIGIGFCYQLTGTLNLIDLAERLPSAYESRTVLVAFAFIFVGISIKLAVFPVHQWLPNAYTYAPSAVSAFLAATATKVSYYVLVRVIFTVFGVTFVFGVLKLHYLLVPLSIAAMFIGSIAAIYQDNIKRILAYSSIAQIGYMTLGLSMLNVDGLTGGLVHIFNHALMKGGLFLVVGCITCRLGSAKLEDMAGIGKKMPWTMAAFVVGGLSLIGVPATVGFISKWYLVLGAIRAGWYLVAVLILLSSLLAVIYIWRIVEVAYFRAPSKEKQLSEAPVSRLVPTWILIGATLYFGLHTGLTVGVAQEAAVFLFGGAVP